MGIQIGRDVVIEQGIDPEIMWRNSLWAFVLSNPQVLVPTPRLRTPDLELTIEAAARFNALATHPHDPSASKENLDRAVDALRRRKARQR